ncbi:MAG: YcxB family protein [Lachnospiraceae bacterium]|nr:YcxB family protein [Lachnospiraceae bacterium]
MDENELKASELTADGLEGEVSEAEAAAEDMIEGETSEAETAEDVFEDEAAVTESEETGSDSDVSEEESAEDGESSEQPLKAENRKKTEEELKAENEARCDEALTTEKFCLTYTLRFKDLAKFNLRYSLLGIGNSLFWLVLIISIAYLATSWTELGAQRRALIIILVVFLIWYVPIRAVINAAKSASYLRNQSTPTEYHVCENGFVICQEGERGLLEYSKISRLKETKSTLYAYVFRNSGFIFPKDIVADRYEELKALLYARAGKK